jgi:hypothetical protein
MLQGHLDHHHYPNGLEHLQTGLHPWSDVYRHNRTHTGTYCYGRMPLQTSTESLSLVKDKMHRGLLPAAYAFLSVSLGLLPTDGAY